MLLDYRISPIEYLKISKEICGYSKTSNPHLNRLSQKFKVMFGISAERCSEIFTRVEIIQPQHQKNELHPLHLLWALHFMRSYPKLQTLCTTLKVGCNKVVMKNVWYWIKRIALLAHQEVRVFCFTF